MRVEPKENSAIATKLGGKTVIKIARSMVSIKCSREINKTKIWFLLSHGLDDVVVNKRKRGFSGMVGLCKQIEKSFKGD